MKKLKSKKPEKSGYKIPKISNKEVLIKEIIEEEEKNINNNYINNEIVAPYSVGESIVKIIIDKIIALSVIKVETNKIYSKNKFYYFNYINNQMNNLFSLNFMCYTEEPENSDYSKFWKTEFNKNNTWVEILEPESKKCDRHEGICVRNIEYEYKDNNIPLELRKSINGIEPLMKENNKDKKEINNKLNRNRKNKKIAYQSDLESLQEVGSDSGEEELVKTKEKIFPNKKYNLNKTIRELENINNNKEQNESLTKNFGSKNKYRNIEFSSEDIPGIKNEFNFDKYDPPEINDLRRAFEKFSNEKAAKKLLTSRKSIKVNAIAFNNDKKFDFDKLTFDSNGQIIKFKPLSLNSLSNEFRQLKNNITNATNKSKKITLPINKIKKFAIKKKSINSKSSQEILSVEKNPADEPDLSLHNFFKNKSDKKAKGVPGGDNFPLMLPSVGVVVKGNERIKKGNRDFGKFFKKYSLEDYQKILKDNLPLENENLVRKKIEKNQSSTLIGNSNNLMSLSINNSANNNNYNMSFDLQNPLIKQDTMINQNIETPSFNNNSGSLNNKIIKNKVLNNSSFSFNDNINPNINSLTTRNNLHFNSNLSGFIKLKNAHSSSLKLELDSLNDLDNKYKYFSPDMKRKKLENIFSQNYKKIFKKEKLEDDASKELDEFNKRIIKNGDWGNTSMKKNISSQNIILSKHRNKSQLFREFGNQFINNYKLKLPRGRKISVII